MSREHSEFTDARLARIKREAADWVIKQSYDFTPEDQDRFFEWLAADPEHAEVYQKRLETWKQLDILADWRPEHSLKPNKDLLEGNQPKKRGWFGRKVQASLALAATLLLGGVAWWVFNTTTGGSVPLASGEFAWGYERHVLEDGSVVELNLGSQAFLEFDEDLRRVSLSAGEAHFTIAKDPNRPFVVEANGVAVQAIGTIFNVQIEEESVNVLVTEGRVRVGASRFDEPAAEPELEPESSQELTAGQHSRIDLREEQIIPKVETLSEEEVENKLTWLKQVINFDDAPLSDIVVEFNRRNYRKIVIEDPSIADVRLSVTIRPNNIDDFVELLELTSDIRAKRIDNSFVILRSR